MVKIDQKSILCARDYIPSVIKIFCLHLVFTLYFCNKNPLYSRVHFLYFLLAAA